MFPKGVPQIPVCVLVRRVGAMLGWVCVFPRRPYEAVALRGEAVAQTPGELAGSVSKGGLRKGPSPPPHAEGQSLRRPARQPWGVLPRAWSGLSEMALRDSLREERASRGLARGFRVGRAPFVSHARRGLPLLRWKRP